MIRQLAALARAAIVLLVLLIRFGRALLATVSGDPRVSGRGLQGWQAPHR
jgi:hypothetical protein